MNKNAILVGPILRHSHTFWSVCFDSAFSRSSWIFAARWERRAWPRMITGQPRNPWIAWRQMGHLSRQLATDSHWRSLAVKCCSIFAPGVSEARLVASILLRGSINWRSGDRLKPVCLCTRFCFKAGLLSHEILHQSFILIPSGNNGRLLFQKANQSHL